MRPPLSARTRPLAHLWVLLAFTLACVAPGPVEAQEAARVLKVHKRRSHEGITVQRLSVRSPALGRTVPVDVVLPPSYFSTFTRFPTLYLLGGATEAKQGAEVSVGYWVDRIGLLPMLHAVWSGQIEAPLARYFRPAEIEEYRGWLKAGVVPEMIVVLPHTETTMPTPAYRKYFMEELPRVIEHRYRVIDDPSLRGIDGACLGGTQALLLAGPRPDRFRSLGSMQTPANIYASRLSKWLVDNARLMRDAGVQLNLPTSDRDIYRTAVLSWGRDVEAAGLSPRVRVLRGVHGYAFYREAGGYDLLFFHGRNFRSALDIDL